MQYPYTSLLINGREETLSDICTGVATAHSDFERHTFAFLRDWIKGDDIFEITTSGSTGTPKRITITRKQMVASATLTQNTLGLEASQNALVCLDTRYIAGRMMIVRCFVTGMRIVAMDPSANPFKDLPDGLPIHFAALVPYQVYDIVRSPFIHRLADINNVIIGGAALDAETRDYLEGFHGTCYATYAMTETLSHVALQPLNGPKKDDLFHTLDAISIRLDDRRCLAIRTPYLQEEVVTNDLVEILSATTFRWLGRFDNVINSGGIKIIPEHLEEELQRIFQKYDVKQRFFITSLPDLKLGNRVVLVVEGVDWGPEKRGVLNEAIRAAIPRNQAPKEVLFVSAFEMTENGKVNRNLTIKKHSKTV